MEIDYRTGRPKVKEERKKWRDLELSIRHKQWGFDCPAVDLDFIMTEFDNRTPCALIEHKHKECGNIKLSDANLVVIINLGNMAKLPVFFTKYDLDEEKDKYSFSVLSLNKTACEILSVNNNITWWTEKQYVKFLYMLRKRELPEGLFDEYEKLIKVS
jgi:hypothetical protein